MDVFFFFFSGVPRGVGFQKFGVNWLGVEHDHLEAMRG